jgi:hypothetical protein
MYVSSENAKATFEKPFLSQYYPLIYACMAETVQIVQHVSALKFCNQASFLM